MPEEINRVVTDRLADFLFTPSEDGDVNLEHEGVPAGKIYRVGNVMIDSLVRLSARRSAVPEEWVPRPLCSGYTASAIQRGRRRKSEERSRIPTRNK